jgi:hypothetical protein
MVEFKARTSWEMNVEALRACGPCVEADES